MGTEIVARGNTLPAHRKKDIAGEVIGAFESETVAVFLNTAPRREHVVVLALCGFLLLCVILGFIVNLDIVVSGTGIISPVAGQIYVSPYNTGIIKKVNVKAGDFIKKGEPLATLDPTITQANLLQLQEHLASDEATVAREEAEVAQRPFVFTSQEHVWKLQQEIYTKRQGEFWAQVHDYDEQIRSTQAVVEQYESDTRKYTERLKIATDVEHIYQPMLDKGYVSELQLLSATDARTEMSRLLADAIQQAEQNKATVQALTQQREEYIQQWYAETGAQLILDKNDLDTTRDSLTIAQKYQDLVSLDAPEDAIVVAVGKVSPGSTYAGGGQDAIGTTAMPLFTLMPVNAPLFADIMVQTNDAGFVKAGQPVNLLLDAYRFTEYGMVKGLVESMSENSFTADVNNTPVPPYFKVHVKITEVKLHHVPKSFRLLPGHTLTGDVLVGRRTIMSYIVEGILRQTSTAMREP